MTEGFFLRLSPRPRQERRNPQSPPSAATAPFSRGLGRSETYRSRPFCRGASQTRPLCIPPKGTAAVRRSSVGRTGATIPARGRQQAGESPFDLLRRGERHPPSGHHERRFLRTIRFLSASLVPFCARRKELALRRNKRSVRQSCKKPTGEKPAQALCAHLLYNYLQSKHVEFCHIKRKAITIMWRIAGLTRRNCGC